MDFTRLPAPSISIDDSNTSDENSRSTEPQKTMSDHASAASAPLPIPTRDMTSFAPPPLPPPPRISDLEHGHDAGWLHGNSEGAAAASRLPPINPESSLFGSHRRSDSTGRGDQMVTDEDDRKGHQVFRAPETQIRIEPPPPAEEGFRNSVSMNAPGPGSM